MVKEAIEGIEMDEEQEAQEADIRNVIGIETTIERKKKIEIERGMIDAVEMMTEKKKDERDEDRHQGLNHTA